MPRLGLNLREYRRDRKLVRTLSGEFTAVHKIMICPKEKKEYRSERLFEIVPKRCPNPQNFSGVPLPILLQKDLRLFHKKEWLQHMVERLKQEPQSGKPLIGKLHGLWQLRIGPFRVWYEIDEEQKKVTLRAILHKDDAKKYY